MNTRARFENSCAVITGAGGGIGGALATRLASEGARVVLLDVALSAAEARAAALRKDGAEALALECDVSDPASIDRATDRAVSAFGAPQVLCNCAGVQQFGRTETVSFETWSRILGINLTGTFLMCRALLTFLVETRGTIVNVASMAGLMGLPYDAAYCASKGGVVMLTRSLAKEFRDRGVRVNAVAPGGVKTSMMEVPFPEDANPDVMQFVPMSPYGTCDPETIAAAMAYLASEEAEHVTGTVLPVDGGVTA
jgi:NAD(P)-dependent dehydrogenase (short-subunit alcohol dehydrogenase family)